MRWAASTTSTEGDLQRYFQLMANTSDKKELIASHVSEFSHAEIWQIGSNRNLILNNVIMSNTGDERLYHEMLVHPALLATDPQRVLIIGGGEGAVLREVLRNARVEEVVMVDIDAGLVNLCREHLPMMHDGSFDSSKLTLVFDDGNAFMRRALPGKYDVIIVDGVDATNGYTEQSCLKTNGCMVGGSQLSLSRSVSYGDVLFTKHFYENANIALRSGGVFVQYMSDINTDESSRALLEAGFSDASAYSVSIDSFFGAGARFLLAAKGGEALLDRIQKKLAVTGGFKHLDGETFQACTREAGIEGIERRLKGIERRLNGRRRR